MGMLALVRARSSPMTGSRCTSAPTATRGMAGVHDLFVAHRPTLAAPFDAPMSLATVNSTADDDDPWVSTDGHVLLFSSTRSGNAELHEARR